MLDVLTEHNESNDIVFMQYVCQTSSYFSIHTVLYKYWFHLSKLKAYDIIDYLSIPREYILGYIHITYKRIGPWCWFNSYLRNITYGKLSSYERFHNLQS